MESATEKIPPKVPLIPGPNVVSELGAKGKVEMVVQETTASMETLVARQTPSEARQIVSV